MTNKTNNISIGGAIDLVIKNADERLTLLESQYKALMDTVTAITKKLNYGEINAKSDTEILAEKNNTETKKESVDKKSARILTADMIETEPTTLDWQIRILGQMGTNLVIARYEYEQLMQIISEPSFAMPYKDNKWTIIEFENGLIKIAKQGKDSREYFCLI